MRVFHLSFGVLSLCDPHGENIKFRSGDLAGVMALQLALFLKLVRATR